MPFAGYESGLDAVPLALKGSIVYGVLGGDYLLLLMGAIGGLIASRRGVSDAHAMRLSASFAAISATVAVFILSILDKMSGEHVDSSNTVATARRPPRRTTLI